MAVHPPARSGDLARTSCLAVSGAVAVDYHSQSVGLDVLGEASHDRILPARAHEVQQTRSQEIKINWR